MAPPIRPPVYPGSPIGLENLQAPGNPQDIQPAPYRQRSGRYRAGLSADGLPPAPTFDESQWVKLNGSQVVNLPDASSTLALGAPTAIRNFLGFRNASDATTGPTIYIEFGGVASPLSWIALAPGDILQDDQRIPQDEVFAYAAGAGGILIVVQSQTPGMPI